MGRPAFSTAGKRITQRRREAPSGGRPALLQGGLAIAFTAVQLHWKGLQAAGEVADHRQMS